jgi:hypothetical protein
MSKQERILSLLRSGRSLNRFDAELHGDHTVNSTIAALRRKGYIFLSTPERVPTLVYGDVRVVRYHFIGQL